MHFIFSVWCHGYGTREFDNTCGCSDHCDSGMEKRCRFNYKKKKIFFFYRKMKIDVLIGLLIVMVTVRETMAVAGAVIAGIGAAGGVAGGVGVLS